MADVRDYDPKKVIAISAYPKSGATWLVRLLGDLLDWPVVGAGNTTPVGAEGLNRKGGGAVFQTHAQVCREDHEMLFPTPWHCNVNARRGEGLIHMVRDPRAVAVSAMFYWEINRDGLIRADEAMERMAGSEWPLTAIWPDFVLGWATVDCPTVRYEDLYENTGKQLRGVLEYYDIPYDEDKLPEVIRRQSFAVKRHAIETEPEDNFAYNRGIQMSHLRKGTVGDWRQYLNEPMRKLARELFGEAAQVYGYEL